MLNHNIHSVDKKKTWRILLLKVLLLLGFLLIILRLVQIQLIKSSEFKKIARKQYEEKIPLPPTRGNIYDRNGNILVSNTMFVTFAVDPKAISNDDAVKLANILSRIFQKPRKYYLDKIKSEKRFDYLERSVSPAYKKILEDEKIKGLIIIDEPKRLYHYGSVAGQILGGTNIDNAGISGIELFADQKLCGKSGYMVLKRDGLGRVRASVEYPRVEPENGNNVYLTIDLAYQFIAEEELKKGVENSKADAGIVVMLKPATNEVLAITQFPSYFPNIPNPNNLSNQKIRAITDMFEPGSVFKLVTASAALEKKLVKVNQKFNAENGTYIVLTGKRPRKITDTKPHDYLTFKEAMEQSSNIVMAKISDIIGAEALYTQARNYGFGSATTIDLPGESKGRLKKPTEWSGTTLNTMSYGYEISATPLQIATAYSAVANKGILMRPYLIKKITNDLDETIFEGKSVNIRRAIKQNTAEILTDFFEGVFEKGTAKTSALKDLRMAGKTGTARQLIDGKYTQKKFVASFVGFFPVEDPQIVCLVMIDNPSIGGYTGGVISAPIFREIAKRISMTNSIFNKNNGIMTVSDQDGIQETVVPDVCNIQFSLALKILEKQNLKAESFGTGKIVVNQIPLPGELVSKGSTVKLLFEKKSIVNYENHRMIPNVIGLPVRRAISRLSIEGFEYFKYGKGIVVSQSPEPGSIAAEKTVVSLICDDKRQIEKVIPKGNISFSKMEDTIHSGYLTNGNKKIITH